MSRRAVRQHAGSTLIALGSGNGLPGHSCRRRRHPPPPAAAAADVRPPHATTPRCLQGCENCPYLGMEGDRERVFDCTTSEFKAGAAAGRPG